MHVDGEVDIRWEIPRQKKTLGPKVNAVKTEQMYNPYLFQKPFFPPPLLGS
jgi:hypothetical protein